MAAREIGAALVYYAVVGTVIACAATVVGFTPLHGVYATAATGAAVIVSGYAASVLVDAIAARVKGGRP
ncbi:hypothetical protein [Streptomyces sp. NPDC020298]|uniref:hypothetical protein n=1 Tax=unclassified Streptomyces TaxID=2593676 RepID=UPI0034102F74